MASFTVVWGRGEVAVLHAAGCADVARDLDRHGGHADDIEAADCWAAQDVLAAINGDDLDTIVAEPKPCARRVRSAAS